MSLAKNSQFLAVASVLAGLGVWLAQGARPSSVPRASRAREDRSAPAPAPTPPEQRPAPRAVTSNAPAQNPPAPAPDEPTLMARLRALGETDPQLSLRLARDGNARMPQSTDAPERAWVIAKALVNLQRFDEARAEARQMLEAYRDTPWALDVERHLLLHPPGDSERIPSP